MTITKGKRRGSKKAPQTRMGIGSRKRLEKTLPKNNPMQTRRHRNKYRLSWQCRRYLGGFSRALRQNGRNSSRSRLRSNFVS